MKDTTRNFILKHNVKVSYNKEDLVKLSKEEVIKRLIGLKIAYSGMRTKHEQQKLELDYQTRRIQQLMKRIDHLTKNTGKRSFKHV